MTITDPEQERQRLTEVYSRMSEGELAQVANDDVSLSDVASEVLRAEIERRGLDLPPSDSGEDVAEFQELVTIGQYRDLPDALLAKGSLESAGIESYLADDNMVRMDWFISNLLGGIKLQVRPKDAEGALDVLEQTPPESFNPDGAGEYEQPKCPQCGSHDTDLDSFRKGVALATVWAVALPLPVPHDVRKCNSCGHEWHAPETD